MLIGPQHRFVLLGVGAAQNVVQVQNDILSSVADDHKERALLLLQHRRLATAMVAVGCGGALRIVERTYLDAVPYQVGDALVTETELAINSRLIRGEQGGNCTHTAFLTIFSDGGGRGYLWGSVCGEEGEKLTSENFQSRICTPRPSVLINPTNNFPNCLYPSLL